MGANAQTSVTVFNAGQILTAQQQTEINTGIPVFATTTTRDAAFGGTGEKTLAEGQFAYIEATNTTQYYDGATWQSVGTTPGLTFITGASFTTQTSVSLPNNTFTSTYRNYKLFFQITATTADANISMRLRASGADISTANYDVAFIGFDSNGGAANDGAANLTSITLGAADLAATINFMTFDIISPQVATYSFVTGQYGYQNTAGTVRIVQNGAGILKLTTQVDALTVISSVASSISGVYRVYGYSES